MNALNKIANYFKNFDGIDEDVANIQLSTDDLRFIANLNVKLGKARANEDAYEKGRNDAIQEFVSAMKKKYPLMHNDFGMECNYGIHYSLDKIAEQLMEK